MPTSSRRRNQGTKPRTFNLRSQSGKNTNIKSGRNKRGRTPTDDASTHTRREPRTPIRTPRAKSGASPRNLSTAATLRHADTSSRAFRQCDIHSPSITKLQTTRVLIATTRARPSRRRQQFEEGSSWGPGLVTGMLQAGIDPSTDDRRKHKRSTTELR
eukprot:GHVU01002156.1.p1 GENE.GHVU01002156.1~~GHVU01002156.1.p1  ORF type:complete len:158 (-),score=4.85 GHVU01002156.1:187-660(-)